MQSIVLRMLLFVPLVFVLAACGSSGDDDDGGDDASPRSEATTRRTASPRATTEGGGATAEATKESGGGSTERPSVKDGNYKDGKVRVEISGDRDVTIDGTGNGFAAEGYALFTFTGSKATVLIGFSKNEDDEPGAISVTSEDLVTGGDFGSDCTLKVNQSGNEVKGEFSCGEVDALDPGDIGEDPKVKLKGTFSAKQ